MSTKRQRAKLRAVAELSGMLGITEPGLFPEVHIARARAIIGDWYQAARERDSHIEKARELQAEALAYREVARICDVIARRKGGQP